MVFIINPPGEREIWHLALAIVIWLLMVLAFGIFRAAMLAEPAVAKVEEVCGLMHLEDPRSQIPDLKWSQISNRRNKLQEIDQNYRQKPITLFSGHRTTESY